MIPYQILSKIRPHEVEVHGVRVKVTVVGDNDRLIEEKTCELMKLIKNGLVGVDVKLTDVNIPRMLLLCVEGHCLIFLNFQSWLLRPTSETKLMQLLSDQTICFVGSNNFGCIADDVYRGSYQSYGLRLRRKIVAATVRLHRLAAMILKKPSLEKKSVQELAGEVGIDINPVTQTSLDQNADIFSEEEVKFIVHDVCASYLIGVKLLGML